MNVFKNDRKYLFRDDVKGFYNKPFIDFPRINFRQELVCDNNLNSLIINGSFSTSYGNNFSIVVNGDLGYFGDRVKCNDSFYIYYANKKYKYVINEIYREDYSSVPICFNSTNSISLLICDKDNMFSIVAVGYLIMYEKI